MVSKLFCLVFSLLIGKSVLQILTVSSSCIKTGNSLTLRCKTTDFSSGISFFLSGVSKGGCTGSGTCLTGIADYNTPTQSGTYTEMTISAYDDARDGGSWTCSYGASTSSVFTIVFGIGNCILCVGILIVCLVLAVCSYFVPIVKIAIILYLWYKRNMRTQKVTYIRIIVTSEQKITKASKIINDGQMEDIPLQGDFHKLSIRVRAGDKIRCTFHTDSCVFALTFKIEDMLNVSIGQTIELPTLLKATPEYSAITFSFNGRDFSNGDHRLKKYTTIVEQKTFGEYGIKMTFEKPITICIQNIIVQESKSGSWPKALYWKLMVLFVVINIVIGVTGGIITGHNRSTDGYCVDENVIIIAVLVPMFIFTGVEVALIYFKLIKRTGNEEGSGSQDTAFPMSGTPTPSTVSPNAVNTRSTIDVSSSDVNATTEMGQNSRDWQPPI